jgi:cobalamin biosynthesis protein CbiD
MDGKRVSAIVGNFDRSARIGNEGAITTGDAAAAASRAAALALAVLEDLRFR